MKQKTRDWPQLKLRIPPELHAWLKRQADQNQRSLNGEATFVLRQAEQSQGAQQ